MNNSAAGAEAPKLDGISFAPTLLGRPGEQNHHEHLYWEFTEQGGKQAVLKDQWKGVRLNWNKKPNGPIQLFDLTKDPGETSDVAKEHPEVVATITAIMKAEHVAL